MGEDDNLVASEVIDCRDWLLSISGQYAKDILPLYQTLDWEWSGGVPDETTIVATLRQLAYSLKLDCTWITCASTGGLTAWVEKRGGHVSCGFRFAYEANRYGTGPQAQTGYKKPKERREAPQGRNIVL